MEALQRHLLGAAAPLLRENFYRILSIKNSKIWASFWWASVIKEKNLTEDRKKEEEAHRKTEERKREEEAHRNTAAQGEAKLPEEIEA